MRKGISIFSNKTWNGSLFHKTSAVTSWANVQWTRKSLFGKDITIAFMPLRKEIENISNLCPAQTPTQIWLFMRISHKSPLARGSKWYCEDQTENWIKAFTAVDSFGNNWNSTYFFFFSAVAACFRGRQLQYCFPGLPSLPADTTGKLVTSFSTFQKAMQLFFSFF